MDHLLEWEDFSINEASIKTLSISEAFQTVEAQIVKFAKGGSNLSVKNESPYYGYGKKYTFNGKDGSGMISHSKVYFFNNIKLEDVLPKDLKTVYLNCCDKRTQDINKNMLQVIVNIDEGISEKSFIGGSISMNIGYDKFYTGFWGEKFTDNKLKIDLKSTFDKIKENMKTDSYKDKFMECAFNQLMNNKDVKLSYSDVNAKTVHQGYGSGASTLDYRKVSGVLNIKPILKVLSPEDIKHYLSTAFYWRKASYNIDAKKGILMYSDSYVEKWD